MNFLTAIPQQSHDRSTMSDALAQIIELACDTAIKRAMRIGDVSPRRLLTIKKEATYLTLSEREIYNMIANGQIAGVRHGKRLMIDIRDLEAWITAHKENAA